MMPMMTQIRAMSMMAAKPGDPLSTIAVTGRVTSMDPRASMRDCLAGAVSLSGPGHAPFGPDHAFGPAALVPAPGVLVQLDQDAAVHLRRDPVVELGRDPLVDVRADAFHQTLGQCLVIAGAKVL